MCPIALGGLLGANASPAPSDNFQLYLAAGLAIKLDEALKLWARMHDVAGILNIEDGRLSTLSPRSRACTGLPSPIASSVFQYLS